MSIRENAIRLANLAIADTDLTLVANKVLDAGAEVKRGPLPFLAVLRVIYGDKLATFPIVDSKQEDSNNGDTYPTTENGKKSRGSFYKDYARVLPVFAGIVDRINKIRDAINESKNAVEPFTKWGAPQLQSELENSQDRLKRGVDLLKNAMRVEQNLRAIEEMEGVEISFLEEQDDDGDTVLSSSTKPIHVIDAKRPQSHFKTISVGQFIALDPAAANKNGGGWENLMASARRTGNAGGNATTKGKTVTVITLGTFMAYANELAAFFGKLAGDADSDTAFTKLLAKATDDEALNIGDSFRGLERAFPKVEHKYKVAAKARAKKEAEDDTEKKVAA